MVEQTSENTGAGQQDPLDANSEFNVLTFTIRQMMAQLDTMKLVKVMKVTGGGGALAHAGTVDVLPLVNLVDGSGNASKHGTVYGIPWMRLQGGTGAIILDPKVGDIGYVLCADRDISNVKALTPGSVTQANPGSYRKYSIADGVYVGGLLGEVPTQYIAFTAAGIKIADSHGNVVEMTSTGIKLTAGTVTVQGNLNVTGDVKALSAGGTFVTLVNHKHSANNTPPTPGF